MAIASGSYGYVVVKAEWVMHEGIQRLLSLPRHAVVEARQAGYHFLDVRILDDSTGSGLLAEVEIPRHNGLGEMISTIRAQVLIPWHVVETVVCFSHDDMSTMRKGIGFHQEPPLKS